VGAGVTIYHDEENITGNTYEHVDYPWSLDVIVKLPSTPTPNVGQFSFSTPMSDKHEHTEEDEVRYSVCELADTTPDPKYIPYNDTFDENGKPEQYRAVTLRVNPHNPPITTIEMEADFAILNGKWEEMSSSAGYSPLVLNCYGSAGSAVIGDADLYAYQYTPYGGPYITSIHSSYTIIQPDIDIEDCPEADEWTKGQGLQLNNDDDNGDQIPDNEDNYVNGPDDRLDMLTVEIDLQPRDQNLGGSLKLVKKGGGKIRIFDYEYETLIMGPYDTEIDAWWLVFWDIRTLLVEGVEDGGDVELRLEYTNGAFSAFDRVKLRMGCDLDIDSDNNNAYSSPGRTGHEDEIEDVSGSIEDKPGKIIVVNDGDHDDTDLDGIPDGDGIRDDLDGYGTGDAYKCSGLKFVPLIFSFRRPTDPNFNLNNVRVRVTYDTCSLFADPPDGNLRIWKQQGDVHRDSRTADNGGHFVPGNPNTYTASQLGINATTLKTTLYVEAVQPSLVLADEGHRITFELDVENDETFELSDSVRITAAQLSITKAKGLYKNDGSYEEGYLSEDNEGRVYCNSQHNMLTDEPMWSKDMQLVELTVEVIPSTLSTSTTKIAFRSFDPDDPSDDEVADQYKALIDKNGSKGDDNGPNQDGKVNRDGVPKWTAVAPYTVDGETGFATIDQDRKTVVQFNASDYGGDNYIVRTGLRIGDQYPLDGPRTGVMTVWKRIEVEYVRMTSARGLPIEDIPSAFELAFVDFRIHGERTVPDVIVDGKKVMGLTEEQASAKCSQYVTKASGEFTEERPGWFFLAAANEYTPVQEIESEQIYPVPPATTGNAIANGDTVTLDAPIALGKQPDIVYVYKSDLSTRVLFVVTEGSLSGDRRTFEIEKKNYQPVDKPLLQDAVLVADLADYGFADGSTISVQVHSPGGYGTSGISPGLAGRTIIFTGWIAAGGTLRVITHELIHAFGLAHKCGNWDFGPGTASSCTMNYSSWFILDEGLPRCPIPWTNDRVNEYPCVHHIRAIRQAHLENLPGLGW